MFDIEIVLLKLPPFLSQIGRLANFATINFREKSFFLRSELALIDLDYTIKVRVPIIIFAVIVTYGVVFWIGTPTRKGYGYAPKQPIAFSHKLHAGEMQIDCRYCHVGVETSRNATVPSVDTCMNCHATVQAVGKKADEFTYDHVTPVGATLGRVSQSILDTKIKLKDESALFTEVKSIADDGKLTEYLNNIINDGEQRAPFIAYYSKASVKDKDLVDLLAKQDRTEVDDQKTARFLMDELFSINTYKSKEIKKLAAYYESGEALPWQRIYRLPKYVFFSHSVHVNKGINCTNCHGNVADLDTMTKLKPITMGRCINCHRGNYDEYHDGLEEEAVGPENCGACHR